MIEKIFLETFEKCPGSVYFPLLPNVSSELVLYELLFLKFHFKCKETMGKNSNILTEIITEGNLLKGEFNFSANKLKLFP